MQSLQRDFVSFEMQPTEGRHVLASSSAVSTWRKSVLALAALLSVSLAPLTSYAEPVRIDEEVVLSEDESQALDESIPKAFRELLVDETQKNPYFYGDESKIVQSSVTRGERLADVGSLDRLGDFDPRKGRWFWLPHLEIPFEEFKYLNISESIPKDMEKLYFFNRGGVRYVRYFLHPFRGLQNYLGLVKKYELKYDYLARPISSPRSLIAIHPSDPSSPMWVKVSLGLTMSALQRLQKPEKLARALVVNEALEMIPQKVRDQYNFSWMKEPFAALLPGKHEVIIGRDSAPIEAARPGGRKLRSTFSFFHSPDGRTAPDVKALIRESGLSELEFFEKYFVRPALDMTIYLAFIEGTMWSTHTGNYYTEVRRDGQPTGHIVIKDFDGAAFDPELRTLMGRPFHDIHRMTDNPFADFWYAAASGRSGNTERQRLGYVFDLYIRDVYGFNSIGSYMFSYLLNWGSMKSKSRADVRKAVETVIDKVTIELIQKHTGITVTSSALAKGEDPDSGINMAYKKWRDQHLAGIRRSEADPTIQKDLRNEFIRLMELSRVWTNFSRSDVAAAKRKLSKDDVVFFYHEHSGMIQARVYEDEGESEFTVIGWALIEDPSLSATQKSFLSSIGAKKPSKVAVAPVPMPSQEKSTKNAKPGRAIKNCKDLISYLEDLEKKWFGHLASWTYIHA